MFSSVLVSIYAVGKAYMRSTVSLGSFDPSVAFKTAPTGIVCIEQLGFLCIEQLGFLCIEQLGSVYIEQDMSVYNSICL